MPLYGTYCLEQLFPDFVLHLYFVSNPISFIVFPLPSLLDIGIIIIWYYTSVCHTICAHYRQSWYSGRLPFLDTVHQFILGYNYRYKIFWLSLYKCSMKICQQFSEWLNDHDGIMEGVYSEIPCIPIETHISDNS